MGIQGYTTVYKMQARRAVTGLFQQTAGSKDSAVEPV